MARSTFVYVTYIRTTPEKLWSALTEDVEFMKQYWFGVHCESEHHRRRRDRSSRSAKAVGHPLATREKAGAQGRRRFAMYDGNRTQRDRG
jgi:uncharacterized protein YndB with AHSA1/START domain